MFIFAEETKDEKRKKVFDHPQGGKVRFMKYGGKNVVNMGDYLKPLHEKMTENLKKTIPKNWRDNLEKVWADVELLNKLIENMRSK